MELIRSDLLTVPHGFPTRWGGVSQPPFATLNLSDTVGDDAPSVAENLARVARAAGVAPQNLVFAAQVHGARVLEAVGPRLHAGGADEEADGLWTGVEGLCVGVRTADCVPVLIEDPVGRRVAAVHAGWRGVVAEIVAVAIESLAQRGSAPEDLRIVIGPSIQRCCFEVDGQLAERFGRQFGSEVVASRSGQAKPTLDLQLAVRSTALRCGVLPARLESLGQCTRCDERFFSHRRERGVTGRHLSFITCRFTTGL